MKLITVSSQLGMGKDVICDYLAVKLGKPWKRAAFANAVKSIFASSFGVTREFVETWKRNPEAPPGFSKNIRQSLQFIGDGFRQIQPNIWVDIALREDNLIISDGRYFSEAKAVNERDGVNILLYRPGYFNDDPNTSESQIRPLIEWCAESIKEGPIYRPLYYEDEACLPKMLKYYNYFLVNDGSLQDLYNKLDKFVIPWLTQK